MAEFFQYVLWLIISMLALWVIASSWQIWRWLIVGIPALWIFAWVITISWQIWLWPVIVWFVLQLVLPSNRQIWLGYRSKSWPTTDGTILESKIVLGSIYDEYESEVPLIHYRYCCAGVWYESESICFQEHPSTNLIRSFRPGETVKVSYDPTKPSRAVLLPGVLAGAVEDLVINLSLAAGVIWAALSVALK